jgi:FMN reductase
VDRVTPQVIHITTLNGSIRRPSRTAALVERFAALLAQSVPQRAEVTTIETSDYFDSGAAAGSGQLSAAMARIAESDIVIVASPTYKATYTGVLKAFLDLAPARHFEDILTIPFMVYGDPQHALAAEVHLRPLLNELGALCPTDPVVVGDGPSGTANEQFRTWVGRNLATIELLGPIGDRRRQRARTTREEPK